MIAVLLVVVDGVVVLEVVVVVVVIGFVVVVVVVVVVVLCVVVVKSEWYDHKKLVSYYIYDFLKFAKLYWKFLHKCPMQFSRVEITSMNTQKVHEIR